MTHLLDYNTLKEWGFIWASKSADGKETVLSYILQDTFHTDMFGLSPVSLSVHPSLNLSHKWYITVLDESCNEKEETDILFKGKISCKTDLKVILKSVIIFKPKKK